MGVMVEPRTDALTAHHRCDACTISRASIRVQLESGLLDFCGHHFAQHQHALPVNAKILIDQRDHDG